MDWVLYGSNDWGQTWTPLDARTGETFSAHPQRKVYTIPNPGAYSSYELQIKKTANGSIPGTGGFVGLSEFELLDSAGQNIARDPASLLMGADEQWGQMYVDQHSVVAPSSIQIPTSLQPFDFEPKRAATIIEVTGFTGTAIQAAINQAAAMPAGTNPVVHLKKGIYNVSSTITIPRQIPITIVGDGASDHGSVLTWTGTGAGPVVWLKGPSRVTLHDLSINGGSAGGADGVLIDNANQQGGRIYGYEVQTSGNSAPASHLVDAGFDISGVNQTAVDINASGFSNFLTGVRVTGGPGHVQFLTGSSTLGNRLFDVKAAGALLATAYWYEGDWPYVASLLDLPSTSSGSLSLASMFWTANSPYPTVRAQSFPGTLTILNSALNPSPSTSPFMSLTGDGSQSNILSAGNFLASNVDPVALAAADQTNPPGQISQIINSNAVGTDLPAITNKVVGAQPTPAFVENQLALLRTIDTTAAVAEPAGVTDVNLLRVFVSAGDNRIGVRIVGVTAAAFALPTFPLSAFGPGAGGWSSDDTYPRELADVNGDGRADIVGFSSAGVYESLAAAGGRFATPTFELAAFGVDAGGWSSDNTYPRALADVNGDTRADVIAFSSAGVYESLATAGGHFAMPTFELAAFGTDAGGWSSDNTYPREVADVNGDGRADVIGFSSAGVFESLATPGGHFAMPTFELAAFGTIAGGWSSDNTYPRALADVNGDGKADIVGFGADGVYVSLATGGGHFAAPTLELAAFGANAGGWTSQDLSPRTLADVNGDGMADIVGFSSTGVYESLATGGGHFAWPTFQLSAFGANAGGWNSDNTYPRQLADINGNGTADIIGFATNGVWTSPSLT
jgi:FG-GAP-like repeat